MKCSICNLEIEAKKDKNGKVIWDKGNNAQPINDGRCCDWCNENLVSPLRIRLILIKEYQEKLLKRQVN